MLEDKYVITAVEMKFTRSAAKYYKKSILDEPKIIYYWSKLWSAEINGYAMLMECRGTGSPNLW